MVWAICGLLTGSIHFVAYQHAPDVHACLDKNITFTAQIADFPREVVGRTGDVITLLTLDSVRITATECSGIEKASALWLPRGNDKAIVSIGDEITGIGRFKTANHQWAFGRFPNNLNDLIDGIRGRLVIREITKIDDLQRPLLTRVRSQLSDALNQWSTSNRAARHLQALLLGRQQSLTEDDWYQLKAFGISHALVVSGLHVGLVSLWISVIISLPRRFFAINPSRGNYFIEAITVCAGTYTYVVVTGMSLPAERAFLMIAIATLVKSVTWSVHPMAVISVVAGILLMQNPLSGLTASFWLSLVMTGIILFHQTGSTASLRSSIKLHVTLALTSCVLSIIFFAQTTTVGLIANMVLVPIITSVVLPLGLIGLLFAGASSLVGKATVMTASGVFECLLELLDWLITRTDSQLLQSIWFHPAILIVAFFILVAWLHSGIPRTVIVCGLSLFTTGSVPPKNVFELSVFDVGQGTMVMARSADSVVIYDAGGRSFTGRPILERGVLRWLRQQGVSKIDLLIVSHGDEDHSGGLSSIKTHFHVAEHLGYAGEPCRPGMHLPVLPNVTLTLLSGAGQSQQNRNDDSCVLLMQYDDKTILLPGDISRAIELDLIAHNLIEGPVHVLVAAHHGSSSSSSSTFVDAIEAEAVVFTTSLNNQFGHPHSAVADRFEGRGTKVFNTATQGSIDFQFRSNAPWRASTLRNNLSPYWTVIPGHKIRLAH